MIIIVILCIIPLLLFTFLLFLQEVDEESADLNYDEAFQ